MRNYLERKPGHKIWKWNLKSLEITIEENVTEETGNVVSFEKYEQCWYCSALNEENSKKQFDEKAKRLYENIIKTAQHD